MHKTTGYLSKYLFEWDFLDVVVGGRSALDAKFFVLHMHDKEQVDNFLTGYGFDPKDPINKAELFGNFQESLQFVKQYFLKEGNPQGLDFKIPNSFYNITEIEDLFLMATGCHEHFNSDEERLWAELLLKVMHTILHVDKDLRNNYLKIIKTQILDRFYKYLIRKDDKLFIGQKGADIIEIVHFESRPQKTRDSIILKLLHKAESVAEELFDSVAIRVVTKHKFDTLRIIKFYLEKNVIIPHNVRPSRTINTMIDLKLFKENYQKIVKEALKNDLTEEDFLMKVEDCLNNLQTLHKKHERNEHTLKKYHSIHFTGRQLIKYKNPFFQKFNHLRQMARMLPEENEFAKNILSMDLSLISRDIRFFYPYEVQIVDNLSHRTNTQGDASHKEYKRNQVQASMKRIFKHLIKLKNTNLPLVQAGPSSH